MPIVVQTKEMREALLDAADKILAEHGYQKMTIDDLAREVGIGKGSVYLHFSSKEEIALSRVDRLIERLKEQLKMIAAKSISPTEALHEMILMRVLFRFDSVQHYKQSLNDLLAVLRPKLLARREKYFAEEAAIFAEVIERGQASGDFISGDLTKIANTFLLATNALLPYSLTTKELGLREEIEAKTDGLANLLIRGILNH